MQERINLFALKHASQFATGTSAEQATELYNEAVAVYTAPPPAKAPAVEPVGPVKEPTPIKEPLTPAAEDLETAERLAQHPEPPAEPVEKKTTEEPPVEQPVV